MTEASNGASLGRPAPTEPQVTSGGERRATGGLLGTLAGVLFRPGRTFAALRETKRRRWLVPVVLTVLALAAYGVVYAQRNADVVYQQQMQLYASIAKDTPQGMDGTLQRMDPHPLTVGLSIAGQVAVAAFGWLAWAGLLALASTFFGQNGASFGGFFAMITWARLPLAIRSGVQAAYMAMSGTCIYNQGLAGLVYDKTPTASAAVMGRGLVSAVAGAARTLGPTRGQQVLAALLGRVDIYVVWSLILTVGGVWAFARLPRRKAVLVTLGIWIVATAAGLLPALIGLGQGARIF